MSAGRAEGGLRFFPVVGGLTLMLCLALPAHSSAEQQSELFPLYPELESNVAFWRDVFSVFSSRSVVFHDLYELDIIYSKLDLSDILDGKRSEVQKEQAVRARVRAERQRLGALLRRIASGKVVSPEEQRVATLIQSKFGSLSEASTLAHRFRPQRGLADKLCGAVTRMRQYEDETRPLMEKYGVPADLLALPLVESSYTIAARSYAGAVGIWQFTRGTGRRFLHIDHVYDDRRDPLRATEAAARYLRENHDRLGNWPLAITAYNHGAGGVAYAAKKLKTDNLGAIVKSYRSRRFGFASRNFYAEFLAAREVAARAEEFCGAIEFEPRKYRTVILEDFVDLEDLARCAGMTTAQIVEINPALSYEVTSGRARVPKGYQLRLPELKLETFEKVYAGLPAERRHQEPRNYLLAHRLNRGQTLSHLAGIYHTTVSELKRLNNISDPRRLRFGQIVKVPVRGSRAAAAAESPASSARSSAKTYYAVHRISRGETLSRLARRYNTKVSFLQYLNDIRDPRNLRAGSTIRVPVRGSAVASPSASGGFVTHTVASGQTLSYIARHYGTTVAALTRYNGIANPHAIRRGQSLKVPR
ncbi:MAG: LysM peptidoglycan-binding domain-containing protein [Candidatus Binatia bacterium]